MPEKKPISRRIFLKRSLTTGASVSAAALIAACSGRSAPKADQPIPAQSAPSPSPSVAGSEWKRLRLGAGGFVTGISIARDGTKVVHTDTHNAYIWNEQGKVWNELFTRKTLANGEVPFPSYSKQGEDKSDGPGCWEAVVADSDSTVIYAVWNAYCYRSTDRGRSFQKTRLPRIFAKANDQNFAGAIERLMGPKMAIDPANANVVWVSGDMGDGLWMTSDGGGSWTQNTDIPKPEDGTASANRFGPFIVVFDPSSPIVGGKTQGIYVASYGKGLFRSRDGGATFQQIPGAPLAFRRLNCDQLGRVWVCDISDTTRPIRMFENGAWSSFGVPGVRSTDVAVNPANAAHIIAVSDSLGIVQSHDNGATWEHWYGHSDPQLSKIRVIANDVPWLSVSESAISCAAAEFDPQSGHCYFPSGVGIFYMDAFPAHNSTKVEFKSKSFGIEQLCVWRILAPPGGGVLTAQLDRSAMRLTNPDMPPTSYGPSRELKDGFDLDYSFSDPQYIVALSAKVGNFSGYSNDNGDTWQYFPGRALMSQAPGGSIAVSAPGNVIHVPNNNGVARYTLDGGATWSPLSIEGLPPTDGTETGWGWAWYFNRKILCADKVQSGVFYAYNYGPTGKPELAGLWRSTDSGRSWTRVRAGTIGSWTTFHAQMNSVPNNFGHLFFTAGAEQGQPLYRSKDGGTTWNVVTGFKEAISFGFGKARGPEQYPTVFVLGWRDDEYAVWASTDDCGTWKKLGGYPLDSIDTSPSIAGDLQIFGRCYVAFGGSGAAYIDSAL